MKWELKEQYKAAIKQSWFFDKINKTDKPLTKLTKSRRVKTQNNKISNEKGDTTTDITEIQRIIRKSFENIFQ
jgi:hypothetical protein